MKIRPPRPGTGLPNLPAAIGSSFVSPRAYGVGNPAIHGLGPIARPVAEPVCVPATWPRVGRSSGRHRV